MYSLALSPVSVSALVGENALFNCNGSGFNIVWIVDGLLGRHGSASLCRDERENKMAATYNVLAFKR